MEEWMHIRYALIVYFILLTNITVHEWAHAFVANWLGDPTPRLQGRLSLNPIVHIDILGTVALPLITLLMGPSAILIAWGKPVNIDLKYFKNKVWGDIMVSLAGPLSNILLAVAITLLGSPFIFLKPLIGGLIAQFVLLNIVLAVFNLLPVPPLDGASCLKYIFKLSEDTFNKMGLWGFFILLGMLQVPVFRYYFQVMIYFVFYAITSIAHFVYGIPVKAFILGRL